MSAWIWGVSIKDIIPMLREHMESGRFRRKPDCSLNGHVRAFFEGIKYAKEGNHLHQISNAIGAYCESFGYGVVRDLVGHGVGAILHEDPQIPNFAQKSRGIRLRPGMTLAIEPMVNVGRYDVDWKDDDWTVVTQDGSLSAHYENTVLITEGEPEILTLTDDERALM